MLLVPNQVGDLYPNLRWCAREDSNLHCTGSKPVDSYQLVYARRPCRQLIGREAEGEWIEHSADWVPRHASNVLARPDGLPSLVCEARLELACPRAAGFEPAVYTEFHHTHVAVAGFEPALNSF